MKTRTEGGRLSIGPRGSRHGEPWPGRGIADGKTAGEYPRESQLSTTSPAESSASPRRSRPAGSLRARRLGSVSDTAPLTIRQTTGTVRRSIRTYAHLQQPQQDQWPANPDSDR